MGVCQSLQISPEGIVFDRTTASERDHDKLIEENLLQSMEEAKRTVKCLLLGTGESGKSTFIKQMKILHMNGFDEHERARYARVIQQNTLDSMQTLCAACQQLNIEIEPSNKNRAEALLEIKKNQIPLETAEQLIAALWKVCRRNSILSRIHQRPGSWHSARLGS